MQQVHVRRWNQSHVSVHVKSVRDASSHNAAKIRIRLVTVNKLNKSSPTTTLCSTRAYNLRIDLDHDATFGERSNNSKKILRVTKINLEDASNEREGVHLHTLEDR